MNETILESPPQTWTATELRHLLPDRRDALLAEAAARAIVDYEQDCGLADFEAIGEADLHGDSSAPPQRVAPVDIPISTKAAQRMEVAHDAVVS